ncbi:Fe(3+) ABC transporter substrate-binding protein [Lysinibacillus sp. NPDC097162]|uniref:Fe(3+) ABC transporter substrate-binding protein n=1 Tax=Lysinibacillus sp. NPDC097162 TaxID=3364140 RepID=UPI0038180BFA
MLLSGGILLINTGCSLSSLTRQAESEDSRQVVNVFTTRHYYVDSMLFQEFTKRTGIHVNEVKGTAEELVERMKKEGETSSADILLTVDGGALEFAKQQDVLQKIKTETLLRNVPMEWRDKEYYWFGIATRARVIVYAKDRVRMEELSTYEDLTNERWKGKVLVRSSSSLYNQSLLASFIELHGEQQAEKWAQGIVRNFAREPEGGDKSQAKAIVAKVGDVAIMNTYYIGQMLNSNDPEEREIAEKLGVFFPNQLTTGTHVNISGIGLAKNAPNKENAIKFAEFLTSKEGQTLLVQGSFEFPVNPESTMPTLLKDWQNFKRQPIDVASLGRLHNNATEIFENVGWQ